MHINELYHNYITMHSAKNIKEFTLSLLMSYIYGAPNNVSKWPMGFNSTFKGLNIG
jgi:hypothetical protein